MFERGFLSKPAVKALLATWPLHDCPALDAIAHEATAMDDAVAPKLGPKECCADFASVISCDGITDTWECPFCGYRWEAPCR